MHTATPTRDHSTAARAAWRHGLAAATLGGLIVLGGCAVVPAQPRFVGEVVMSAPPPAQVEVYGIAPTPGAVWISGYWNWIGGRHLWTPGHWEAPRAGHYWVPHVWVHTGVGWHLREGYWARR